MTSSLDRIKIRLIIIALFPGEDLSLREVKELAQGHTLCGGIHVGAVCVFHQSHCSCVGGICWERSSCGQESFAGGLLGKARGGGVSEAQSGLLEKRPGLADLGCQDQKGSQSLCRITDYLETW